MRSNRVPFRANRVQMSHFQIPRFESQVMKSRFVAKASAALILLCALSATWESTAADAPNPDVDFATAMEQFRLGKWADAYGKFSRLADRNHADAARIALLMVRFGPSLFGIGWGASQPQIDHWGQLATTPVVAVKSESGD